MGPMGALKELWLKNVKLNLLEMNSIENMKIYIS